MDWFQQPSDATLLTQAVLGDNFSDPGPNSQLRIGLVQRRGQRRNITNLPEIGRILKSDFPLAQIEWGEMEGMSPFEQASFWNRQDVVVAAHGAAMTNAMFLPRNAAVVEIFPLHYYVFMYRELCQTLAVGHFAWVDDIEDPEADYEKHCSVRKVRFQMRSNPMTPPINRILDLVHQAVNATRKGLNLN
jgi:hypothetical protein